MKRNKYNWGKKNMLLSMKVGEVTSVTFLSRRDYRNTRTMASRLGRDLGVYFKFRHYDESEVYYIKRCI